MNRNVLIGLETEPYAPARNLEHGDLENVRKALYVSDDNRLIMLPGQH